MTHEELKILFQSPLLIASHNKGKAEEIIAQIQHVPGLSLKRAADFDLKAPQEPYATFRENAAWKARYAFEQTGLSALADDSGLVVPALEGAPGIHTADWFTNQEGARCFNTGFDRLNAALQGKERTAFLVATLALILPNQKCYFFECELKGVLLETPAGLEGFGFDPIFRPEGFEHSFAEMSQKHRAELSPRAQAARSLSLVLMQERGL